MSVERQPGFQPGAPQVLFTGRYVSYGGPFRSYDVAPDGQRLLMIKPSEQQSASAQLHVVLN